jgi:hypothetical protein
MLESALAFEDDSVHVGQCGAMTWEIRFGGDPEDALVETHGVASVEGLNGMMRDVAADPRAHPEMSVLVDHGALDWTAMSADDLRRRGEAVPRVAEETGGREVRVAIVAPHAAVRGLYRMMEAFSGGFGFEWTLASTVEEARCWLSDGAAAARS